jgi:hypothetical protein
MIQITIPLEMVETLICPKTSYYGSVLLLELKSAMEHYIATSLERGGAISISDAFNYVWSELVVSETDISSSYEDEEDDF